MSRLSRRRTARPADPRPFSIGSHWRADGRPKAAFRSQMEAARAAGERQTETGVLLQVYACDVCTSWHLGGSEGRRR